MWLCPDCTTHECSACGTSDPPLCLTNHIICGPEDDDDDEEDEGAARGREASSSSSKAKKKKSSGKAKRSTVAKLGCDHMFHLACVGLTGLPEGSQPPCRAAGGRVPVPPHPSCDATRRLVLPRLHYGGARYPRA